MSEVKATQASRYNRYKFGELYPGDSHFIFKAEYKQVYEAWRAYMRLHPDCLQWDLRIDYGRNGIIYKRLK
jgi:hypothetical protein